MKPGQVPGAAFLTYPPRSPFDRGGIFWVGRGIVLDLTQRIPPRLQANGAVV